MQLKFKTLHAKAIAPSKGTEFSAGWDLTAISREYDNILGIYTYDTGIAFEIPDGMTGFLFPRSSVFKKAVRLANCVGVIDSDYRDSVKFKFDAHPNSGPIYEIGQKIGQIVFIRTDEIDELVEVAELSKTSRGKGGFGHTGE